MHDYQFLPWKLSKSSFVLNLVVIFISVDWYYTQDTSKCEFQDAWAEHDQGASFFNGCSIKNGCNDKHVLLSHPRRTGLETFDAALLILIRE